MNGFVMFLYSLLLLYMNTKILSRSLSMSPVRFLALRVVLDPMDQELPRLVETIIADGGRREWLHAARAVLTNPLMLRRLVPLAIRSAQAQRALRRAVAALDPTSLASAVATSAKRVAR